MAPTRYVLQRVPSCRTFLAVRQKTGRCTEERKLSPGNGGETPELGHKGKPVSLTEAPPQQKKEPFTEGFGIFGGKKKDADKRKAPENGESP